jgi:hypothetical protein
MYQQACCALRPAKTRDPSAWQARAGQRINRTFLGEIVMIRIHHIRRLVRILAGLVGALVALGVAAPAAFARVLPDPGPASGSAPAQYSPPRHAAAVGMAGWQIALIAIAAAVVAAVVAATIAVLVDRARSARRLRAATATT